MARIVIVSETEVGQEVANALSAAGHEIVRAESPSEGAGDLLVVEPSQWRRLSDETEQLRGHGHAESGDESPEPNGDGVAAVARSLAGKPLADIEKQVILSTLEQFKGHRLRTAAALGIGVRTLGMKIKRWREEGEPIAGRHGQRTAVHVDVS